jgi:DNA-binding NarL/FixJ family response regulator
MRSCGTILIADADPEFRAFATRVLHRAGCSTLEAATGKEALETARRERPSLVLLDVYLPALSGYEVCSELRAEFGLLLPIVFVSAERTSPADRAAGLLIGADDYLAKPVAADELSARVRTLAARSGAGSGVSLTRREGEILALLAAGRQRSEIAEELVISRKTVAKHIERILAKLGVHSESQAVGRALREGIVEPTTRTLTEDLMPGDANVRSAAGESRAR